MRRGDDEKGCFVLESSHCWTMKRNKEKDENEGISCLMHHVTFCGWQAMCVAREMMMFMFVEFENSRIHLSRHEMLS
jgi:ribulose 1,5-bisphosphate carboxylase large subunit-like protein